MPATEISPEANTLVSLAAFADFQAAAAAVLQFLHARLGMNLWMVTRTEGEDWIVLGALDRGYGVKEGDVFQWSDSFCSRMVKGLGPRVVADSNTVAAYREAPIGKKVKIGAYVGIPLERPDGSLFGTLCAVSPDIQPVAIEKEQPLVELLARMLSTVLSHELRMTAAIRAAERARLDAMRDGLTGLFNRRGWDQLLEVEERRCARYGNPACVVVIDLDDLKQTNDHDGHKAGDDLICRAAGAIAASVRSADAVARVGGDEFAVLCVECDQKGGREFVQRLRDKLNTAAVSASVGLASRVPSLGLTHAWQKADEVMYLDKQLKHVRPEVAAGTPALEAAASV
ncbi:MAG: sensor domain-containing diguanylate cyclase [Tepidisphaerales bacterium]